MNCWHCERPAYGVCKFCGRGLCKEHIQSMPNIIAIYRTKSGKLRAIVSDDVLYCGVCKPKEEPIEMDELDQEQ